MPQIKYTDRAMSDFLRLSEFLQLNAPNKVVEAMQTITDKIQNLVDFPRIGKIVPCEELPNLRKLTIPYGKGAYIALYSYDENKGEILIETIRHSRELEPEFLRYS